MRNKKYDFIVASSILHELDDPNQFLDTIKKLSNPSTVSCIIVPNSHSFHRLLAVSMGLIENEFEMSNTQVRMQQNSTFNLDNLCQLIKEKGFNPFFTETFFIKPFTHKQMAQIFNENIINYKILDGLYNLSKLLPDIGSEILVLSKLQ